MLIDMVRPVNRCNVLLLNLNDLGFEEWCLAGKCPVTACPGKRETLLSLNPFMNKLFQGPTSAANVLKQLPLTRIAGMASIVLKQLFPSLVQLHNHREATGKLREVCTGHSILI
jgi:hypothetical protein